MGKKTGEDRAMTKVRKAFEASGLTLHDLGIRMGYDAASARKSAWQFMRYTGDPRIGMLRKFADALSINLAELVE